MNGAFGLRANSLPRWLERATRTQRGGHFGRFFACARAGPPRAIFACVRAGTGATMGDFCRRGLVPGALRAIFAGAGATMGDFAGARAGGAGATMGDFFCRREGWCWGHGRFSAGDAQVLRQLGSRSGRDLLTQSRRDAIKLLRL